MKTFHLLGVLLLFLLAACSISNVEDFVVGDNFIKSSAGTVMIDTMTLNSSTVKIDSLVSNASGRLLMGCNYNSFSGYKFTNSYFQLQFTDAINYTTFVYDSLCLVLNYDTYYTGDTTVAQTFNVYRLNEEMELNNSYLYTTSHFSNYDEPLGTFVLAPRPQAKDSVFIRLSDTLGKRFAQMLKDKSDTLSTQSLFLNFFNGLVIKSSQDTKGAVFGISTTSSSSSSDTSTGTSTSTTTKSTAPQIRLYYHLSPNPDDLSDLYYKFTFYSDGIYFNQISDDETNSLIDGISESDNELSSKQTGNKILVQSGIQTFAKIKIPYLDNLLWMGKNSGLVAATLKLYPVTGTYTSSDDLPDSLYIYDADHKNQISSQISLPGSSDYAYAIKKVVKDVEEQVYYEADITSFADSQLQQLLETNHSIMIGLGSTLSKKTALHVILGGTGSGKYSPELNVYYYHN